MRLVIAKKENRVMAKEFYAAFIEDSYHVEGDERSRTNPGHGYPAHTVRYIKVEEFESEEHMRKWVAAREQARFIRIKYRIVKCIPMEVKTTINVEVSVR